MSKSLGNVLKLIISLGLGALIVWLTVRQLTAADIEVVKGVFRRTKYIWVILGASVGMLSNVARAERWKMLLNSVGYHPRRSNVIYSVFVMYAGNLIFPRLGEVSRCTLLYKTDNVPVDKSIGTMVLERVVDVVCMLLIGAVALILQYDLLMKFLNEKFLSHLSFDTSKYTSSYFILFIAILLVALISVFIYLFFKMRSHPFVVKLEGFVRGMIDGLLSIRKLQNPLLFIFYSIVIWGMYTAMIVICYNSLPETSSVGAISGFAIVFFGGIAFIVSQGGIGAYPPIVGLVLVLYGVPYEVGFAFGWLVWAIQTAAVITAGVVSLLLVSRNFTFNTTKTELE
ncbi:MAG: hypothetical protein JWO03_1731 [Bacteroidetes bacterium]|nr:hypothetical protein [Bacteroidota bacterium]